MTCQYQSTTDIDMQEDPNHKTILRRVKKKGREKKDQAILYHECISRVLNHINARSQLEE